MDFAVFVQVSVEVFFEIEVAQLFMVRLEFGGRLMQSHVYDYRIKVI